MSFTSTARVLGAGTLGISLMIAAASALADQPTYFRINDPIFEAQSLGSSVTESPDGKHLIYGKQRYLRHSPYVVRNLYSTNRRGGKEYRLTQMPTGTGNGVFFYNVTADSRYVVYSSSVTEGPTSELFSVNLGSREIVRLSGELRPGASVSHFLLSPHGRRVLYFADQTTEGSEEMFIVPTAGGTAERLHDPLTSGQYVSDARFTPDGKRVVFYGDLGSGAHIYAVDLHTHTTVLLSTGLHGVGEYTISPDGQRVVFTAASKLRFNVDLYSVAIDGTGLVRISPKLVESSQMVDNYGMRAISPDSKYVVYRSDHDVAGKFEFFAVGIDGANRIRVSEPRTESVRTNSVAIHRILPDNTVIFSNDSEEGRFHVFATSLVDGTVRRISHEYPGYKFRYETMTPDNQFVLYRASDDDAENASTELYMAPVAGGEAVRVNPDLPPGQDVYGARVSPDNQWIVYHADQDVAGVINLYRVPVKGGVPERINPEVTSTVGAGRSATWSISADSESVYYNAEIDTPGVSELYASVLPIEVPMDLNPGQCPNRVGIASDFPLPVVALAADGGIDLADVDRSSLTLNGIPALKVTSLDVASPSTPYYGKTSPEQCTTLTGDGTADLAMRFDKSSVAETLGPIVDGRAVLVKLKGALNSGGTFIAEDFLTMKTSAP